MPKKNRPEQYVISLGGSLVFSKEGIQIEFLRQFGEFIRKRFAENPARQFFIVVGGGALARQFRDAGEALDGKELGSRDLDWLGIHATKLNAHLVRAMFHEVAPAEIIADYENLPNFTESVVVGGGWKPGWSTDYDAVLLTERYRVKTLINLSVIDGVSMTDPVKNPKSPIVKKFSWEDFRALVGDVWTPGKNTPFDPVASKKAEALRLKVIVMRGNNFPNLESYFAGKLFVGTTIE